MSSYKLLLAALALAVVGFVVIVLLDLRKTPEPPDDPLTAGVGAGETTRLAPENRIERPPPTARRSPADAASAEPADAGAPAGRPGDFQGGDPHDWRPDGVPKQVKWDKVMRRVRGQLVPEVRRCFQDAGDLDDNENYMVAYRLQVSGGRARLADITVQDRAGDPVADCIAERLRGVVMDADAADFETPIVDSFVVYETLEE